MKIKKPSPEMIARLYLYDFSNLPVEIVKGNHPPKFKGQSPYWTTLSGKLIHYPNSYNWPKNYHPSTRKIEVGKGWLHRKRGVRQYKDSYCTGWYCPSETVKIHGFKILTVREWGHYSLLYIISGKNFPKYHIYSGTISRQGIHTRTPREALKTALYRTNRKTI